MRKITILKSFGLPAGLIAGLMIVGGIALASVGGPACNVPADYSTIQGAVNDPGCSTINVSPGTYAEYVTIARSLTLNGANAGVAGNAIRGAESVLVGTTTGALQLTGNNITVDGFKIMSASNALGAGIHMSATASGDMIKNNLITGNQIGIYANSNGTSTISSNLFDANNEPGASGGSAIYSEFSDHLIIDNNEFRNHTTNSPMIFGATGSGVHKNLTVSNNWLHNNENASNIYVLSVAGGNFMGNTISASSTVTGISFSGDDQNVSVSKNIISGGARGIRVEDGGYGLGANMNIMINRNSLTGNSEYGVGNITASTALVDGSCNWWGASNGPGTVGPGTGDKVTTNVTFSPWLGSADLNGPCPQPSTVKVTIDKFIDGLMATSGSASSSSFPMSATWSATNIGSGTGTYALAPVGFNSANPYEAVTADMTSGASYSTNEITGGSVVGASCSEGKPFALIGYKTGDTLALANAGALSTTSPSFTNLIGDKFVVVINHPCPPVPPVTNLLTVSVAGTGSGSVTSNPTGINCGVDCTESYATGTPVTLTATPTAGSMFAGWSGACSGTGLCMLSMTSPKSVTATFTLIAPPPPPKPTDMNECKNGGWMTFTNPSFKNQGQCVSYVQSNDHAGKK